MLVVKLNNTTGQMLYNIFYSTHKSHVLNVLILCPLFDVLLDNNKFKGLNYSPSLTK